MKKRPEKPNTYGLMAIYLFVYSFSSDLRNGFIPESLYNIRAFNQ